MAFVGRVSPEKGLVDAARACALAGRPLHVWGLLQDADEWARALDAMPSGSLTHRGFVDPVSLRSQIGECAALVMAPKWVEAFGNVAVEAMACGLPVISTTHTAAPEIMTPDSGFIVRPGDDDALLEAMSYFAAHPEAIPTMGRAARQAALPCTWQAYGQRWQAVLGG